MRLFVMQLDAIQLPLQSAPHLSWKQICLSLQKCLSFCCPIKAPDCCQIKTVRDAPEEELNGVYILKTKENSKPDPAPNG